MRDLERFIDDLGRCGSWADVAVQCYRYIKDEAFVANPSMTEQTFIAEYIDAPIGAPESNPNVDGLIGFMDEASGFVMGFRCDRISFRISLRYVQELMGGIRLVSYSSEACNQAAVAWFLILAIDKAYAETVPAKELASSGPLNSHPEEDGVGLYCRCSEARLEAVLSAEGVARIPEYAFNDQLSSFVFFKKGSLRAFPLIKKIAYPAGILRNTGTLVKGEGRLEERKSPGPSGFELRVGVCPFTCRPIAGFEEGSLIRFKMAKGSSFVVVYSDAMDGYFDKVIVPALRAAIEERCHILIFPEIVFAPGFHGKLSSFLRGLGDAGNLALIVTGSTWNEEEGSNSSVLYDCKGRRVGAYYKHTPFQFEGEQGTLLEGLKQSDKPSVLVDIPGLGRILPAICKDLVSEESVTFSLAEQLRPQVVCVPAFSRSVDRGFALPMSRLAERHLAISCMANDCAERRVRAGQACVDLGYVVFPGFRREDRPTKKACVGQASIQKGRCERSCSVAMAGSCLQVVRIAYDRADVTGMHPLVDIRQVPINWG